jgi:Protein of unknown function (DUF3263)
MDARHVNDLELFDASDAAVQGQEVDDEVDGDAAFAADQVVEERVVELHVGDGLTERERQVLAFERQWWRRPGAKEQAIRDLFGLSPTRYYQLLNNLLDSPAALEHEPVLVKRLRRLRASRTRTRTAGRVA